ncbi:unnamed protein product [Timema podura]|uniref:Uncharacterized protein n=1 Tax=Timema podura TaxID=61482 RepID=A0ABN7NND5_TIMPD|nr:unnamed protein product [Timema podura]
MCVLLNETTVHVLHSDVVEKNAKELVAEEEREKRKAKKRKEKKKRRREKKKGKENENGNAIDNEDVIVAESERLAMAGYNMASREQYEQAVDYFTRAIRLIHNDHRFFGNRSFCYCQLGHFSKALKDADKAIGIAPQNPKGYYRRGEALHGLKQYKEAEQAFEKVLQLDNECDDAQQELENCRVFQLVEMGFPEKQCRASIKQFHTLQAAIDGLTSNCPLSMNKSDIFYSDEELDNSYPEFESATQHASSVLKDIKMDPSNPEGHTSLWVGNVTQKVTEKQLTALFNKYGPLLNIRLLSEKFCAFVNYRTKTAPGLAMKHLQGKEIGGDHLLIRFPNNPVAEGYQQILVKKKEVKPAPVVSTSCSKLSGPVNGNECHFWRTTGCAFSDKCRYKHVKENKGIDKKPWHKSS